MEEKLLFDIKPDTKEWEKHWQDMPEFNMKPVVPFRTIKLSFRTEEDLIKFQELINQKITNYENYWYPKLNIKTFSDLVYKDKK